jgi:hypothetical protein
MNKRAEAFLPKDLQVAINTFIEQFNIMEDYNLESIPPEYTVNLLETMSKYPEHNSILLDLIDIINGGTK